MQTAQNPLERKENATKSLQLKQKRKRPPTKKHAVHLAQQLTNVPSSMSKNTKRSKRHPFVCAVKLVRLVTFSTSQKQRLLASFVFVVSLVSHQNPQNLAIVAFTSNPQLRISSHEQSNHQYASSGRTIHCIWLPKLEDCTSTSLQTWLR